METFYVVAVKGKEAWSHRKEFDTYEAATKLLEKLQKSLDFLPSVWYWFRIYAKPYCDPKPWKKRKNWWISYQR